MHILIQMTGSLLQQCTLEDVVSAWLEVIILTGLCAQPGNFFSSFELLI